MAAVAEVDAPLRSSVELLPLIAKWYWWMCNLCPRPIDTIRGSLRVWCASWTLNASRLPMRYTTSNKELHLARQRILGLELPFAEQEGTALLKAWVQGSSG